MYNRYIRNDNGVYDRVPQQETAPPSPPRPQPPPPRPGLLRPGRNRHRLRHLPRSGSF